MKYVANPVEVDAFCIVDVGEVQPDGSRWLGLDGAPTSIATAQMMSRMTPVVGDYWVVQSDGYEYLNPAAVFERKYHPAPDTYYLGAMNESLGAGRIKPKAAK